MLVLLKKWQEFFVVLVNSRSAAKMVSEKCKPANNRSLLNFHYVSWWCFSWEKHHNLTVHLKKLFVLKSWDEAILGLISLVRCSYCTTLVYLQVSEVYPVTLVLQVPCGFGGVVMSSGLQSHLQTVITWHQHPWRNPQCHQGMSIHFFQNYVCVWVCGWCLEICLYMKVWWKNLCVQ